VSNCVRNNVRNSVNKFKFWLFNFDSGDSIINIAFLLILCPMFYSILFCEQPCEQPHEQSFLKTDFFISHHLPHL
jgi:hypothetical protein